MHPLKTLSILSVSPVLQCTACRNVPLFVQDFRPQCFAQITPASHNLASSKRSLTSTAFSRSSSTATVPNGFTYRLAASYSAKGRRFKPKEDSFVYDPARQVQWEEDHVTGKPNSGQDAFFISRIGNGSNMAFGVTDGVGGWADSGIDSAHFSHGLCQWMARGAQNTRQAEGKRSGPREILNKAYEGIVADGKIDGGGSTACVAVGRDDGDLTVANLGDSGFVQLRLNAVHYYSSPQTHAFNTPYQLSIVPPRVLALHKAFGGSPLSDFPKDASVTTHQVRHGDVIVFATDGVWDNLSPVDLLKIVSRLMTGSKAWGNGEKGTEVLDRIHDLTRDSGILEGHGINLQTSLAANIVAEAKSASQNTKVDGPFAREVKKHYPNEQFHGGKVDDICVVVAIVVKDDSKSLRSKL